MYFARLRRAPTALIVAGAALAFSACAGIGPGKAKPGEAHDPAPLPGFEWSPDRSGGFDPRPCGGSVRCVGGDVGAYTTIGAAIAASKDGDTVQVAAGDYAETIVVEGRGIALLGGFSADFSTRNPETQETVINAGRRDRAVRISEAGDVTLDGFTITGGKAPRDEWGTGHGSGVWITHSGSVTISRNLIEGNDDEADFNTCDCHTYGGGISAGDNSSTAITDNIVRNNASLRGGGIAVQGRAKIERNLVEGNHGRSDHGGGLYLTGEEMDVRSNLIRSNTIGDQAGYGWGGGGIFYGDSSAARPKVRFEGNRWVSNQAPSKGSGLFLDDSVEGTVVGDLFYANPCQSGGGGIYLDGGGDYGTLASISKVTITGSKCADDVHGSGLIAEGGSHFDVTESIIAGNGGATEVNQCDNCTDAPAAEPGTVTSSIIGGADGAVTVGADVEINKSPAFTDPSRGDFSVAGSSWGA